MHNLAMRAAIRRVLKAAHIAKETGNKALYRDACLWLRRSIPQRNRPMADVSYTL